MAFKLNISDKEKAWRMELEGEALFGKKIGEKIEGKEIKPEFDGYEIEITGTSDKAGFPGHKDIDSPTLTKRLLTRGFGMKTAEPHGLRLRKTLRGGIKEGRSESGKAERETENRSCRKGRKTKGRKEERRKMRRIFIKGNIYK